MQTDPERIRKINFLDKASNQEIMQQFQFLDQQELQELQRTFIKRFFFRQLKTDLEDNQKISYVRKKTVFIFAMTFGIRQLFARIFDEPLYYNTLHPKIQLILKFSVMNRGILLFSIAGMISGTDIAILTHRIAYKHFIIDQYDKNNI